MDSEGLKPSTEELLNLVDPAELVESEAIAQAEDGDKELAAVAATPGWQTISARMQADIDALRTGKSLDINGQMSMAEIGQKFVIASAVATHLQSYLDMVNGALEALSNERTEPGGALPE